MRRRYGPRVRKQMCLLAFVRPGCWFRVMVIAFDLFFFRLFARQVVLVHSRECEPLILAGAMPEY